MAQLAARDQVPPSTSAVPGLNAAPSPIGYAWLLPLLLGAALAALIVLPFLLGALRAPPGQLFGGTLKALGDEGVYMAAVRQGSVGNWLWHDPYMVAPPPPILMYPTYIAFGHLGALLRLSVAATYAAMHAAAGLVLFGTLWQLASRALPRRDVPWFVAFALGAGGLYWLDAALGLGGNAPASLPWMGMPQLSGLTSALMGAHETLGTAGQLIVLAALLDLRREQIGLPWRAVLGGALGTLLVGLTLPMLLPITVGVAGLPVLWRALRTPPATPAGYLVPSAPPRQDHLPPPHGSARGSAPARGIVSRLLGAGLLPVAALLIPGLLVAAYYYWQLSFGGWAASGLRYSGSRPLLEELLQWGVLVPLGVWGWRYASPATRPLAGLLALWCGCALAGLWLPFWQGFRFSTGLNTMLGALFALGLSGIRVRGRPRTRLLLLVSLGTLTHLLFVLSVLLPGRATQLYVPQGRVDAMRWLGTHARSGDLVLAPLAFSNQLGALAPTRMATGHVFLTFDMPVRERQLRILYGTDQPEAARLQVVRATAARYVVYDSQDAEEGTFDPRSLPGLRIAYANAECAVLRVTAGDSAPR